MVPPLPSRLCSVLAPGQEEVGCAAGTPGGGGHKGELVVANSKDTAVYFRPSLKVAEEHKGGLGACSLMIF